MQSPEAHNNQEYVMHNKEDQVELLRRAAGQLGYTLTKKPTGRTKEKREQELHVMCKLCQNSVPAKTAHLHQGTWVGECCWDERLKSTE